MGASRSKNAGVIDEIELHPGAFARHPTPNRNDTGRRTGWPTLGSGLHQRQGSFVCLYLGRYGDGVAQLGQGLRKGADNIRRSAGFGERHALRSSKDDIHGASVSKAARNTAQSR
jgi:hypothetical protein